MMILLLLLVSLSSYVVPDECVSASLSPGGQALMAEASDVVRLETSDTQECEVRLRLVAAILERLADPGWEYVLELEEGAWGCG